MRDEAYTAAFSAGIRASQKKKATTRKIEIIRGAMTCADPQPDPDPLVIAKINKIIATLQFVRLLV